MRALFLDNQFRLSIRRVKEAPTQLSGFAHPPYVRTAIDFRRGTVFYEQEPNLVRALNTCLLEKQSEYIRAVLSEALTKCRK